MDEIKKAALLCGFFDGVEVINQQAFDIEYWRLDIEFRLAQG
jgi:hypothetical protein